MHFVTLLEEMPVQETLDGVAELRGSAGAAAGGHHHQHGAPGWTCTEDQLARRRGRRGWTPHELAAGLKAAGIEDDGRPGTSLATWPPS